MPTAMRSKASRRIVRYSRPTLVMIRRCRSRLKSLTPSSDSKALTWWLTAPWVTKSSSAARVKLSRRAAASKALSAFNGGSRRSIGQLHEENSGRVEKRCFAGNRFLVLSVCSIANAHSERWPNRSATTCQPSWQSDRSTAWADQREKAFSLTHKQFSAGHSGVSQRGLSAAAREGRYMSWLVTAVSLATLASRAMRRSAKPTNRFGAGSSQASA